MALFDSRDPELLREALEALGAGFSQLPALDEGDPASDEGLRRVLRETAERLHDNYPYHHPLYVGQMLKPPHRVARLAYALAQTLNPNNHALDGGRASSAMEKEVVAELAAMYGWSTHLGHLCGGGTMANFEALWVGREERPGRAVVASSLAHYTHTRLTATLGVESRSIAVDDAGRLDLDDLDRHLDAGDVGTVVVTLGTTAAGTVDPLPAVLERRAKHDFRVHVDAAYGGYFTLVDNLDSDARAAYDAIGEADSVVLDPHKHGLQPYGCGCVLFRDPDVGRHYRHDSPYTYFSSDELHLGEISLECSRAGASAVALWATHRLLPPVRGGEFAHGLASGIDAARGMAESLAADERFVPFARPETDIVVWGVRSPTASVASTRARAIMEAAAERDLHLAVATFPRALFESRGVVDEWDADSINCLRMCVMKPEHHEWTAEILSRLFAATDDVFHDH